MPLSQIELGIVPISLGRADEQLEYLVQLCVLSFCLKSGGRYKKNRQDIFIVFAIQIFIRIADGFRLRRCKSFGGLTEVLAWPAGT